MDSNRRGFPRKIVRTPGTLTLEGVAPIHIHVTDISSGGVGITIAVQLTAGQRCLVNFSLLVNGKICAVTAITKVTYSVLGGAEGFKAGLQFMKVDEAGSNAISTFMST